MTLEQLDSFLCDHEAMLNNEQRALLEGALAAVDPAFPFNQWEYRIAFLLEHKALSFAEYEEVRSRYMTGNEFLHLYGLAPRIFGEIWGEDHVKEIDDRFASASVIIDRQYTGEYDLVIEGVKVEVKAARAMHSKLRGALSAKALRYESKDPFWMNFQQLKPDMCDVFVFVGVWVNKIVYWVLSSDEVKRSPFVSPQHRGGIEFQIGVRESNRSAFDEYIVDRSNLAETVLKKGARSDGNR